MKLYSFLVGLLLVGCSTMKSSSTELVRADKERISNTLYYLASDELEGRDTGAEGNRKAASFLSEHLAGYGISPFFTSYNDTLSNVNNSWNVVGVIPGNDKFLKDEVVVFGAHFDHIGIQKAIDGDSIANGANDNATGSAIMLELARNLTKMDNKRTILVAFFTGEEKGLWGSKHLAKRLKSENVNVVSMLNFEMLGLAMKRDYMTYLTGYDESNLAEKLNELAGEPLVGKLEKAEEFKLFKRSDNYPFYLEFKIPSQSFSSFDFENYEYYHHVKDEAQFMDLDFMTSFTNKLIPVVSKLVNLPAGDIRLK
ncbi:M20/M25/M40 family metallo-hydrolase [Myroides phaeus]|uniref:M28 family metallopeptidase n=1 Tax=Myroides phaeus TaxID=702745 RepID=UPI002DB56C6A|nr:M20/M25/M40 family metallo-hydrolase [Myroides phaeus]MEC4116131.1 M20/M25/M40 family metallo-hydrolase [Myroides phaeus]